jgi:hypothetical protein
MRLNCQDATLYGQTTHEGNVFRFGASLDGCGSGKTSEVGAILAGKYLKWVIPQLISMDTPMASLPEEVFQALSMEMWRILPHHQPKSEVIEFLLESLLFTVFAFVQGPEETVVFFIGDGLVRVNGQTVIGKERKLATDNAPDYLAYRLIPLLDPKFMANHCRAAEVYQPKKRFEVLTYQTARIQQLLVGSDAWHDELGILVQLEGILCKLDPQFAYQVQIKMNAWSGVPFRDPGGKSLHFRDDASVALIQRIANE